MSQSQSQPPADRQPASRTTLAILAGGAGSRMGKSKALLRINGQPILAHLLDQIAWPGPTLLVTAPGRENPPGCERFDAQVVDAVPDQGPMRGLLSATGAASTDRLVVATLDMPLIRRDMLDLLLDAMQTSGARCATWRVQSQVQPFPCAIAASCATEIGRLIDSGEFRIRRLLDNIGALAVEQPVSLDDELWTNLNTPADVQRLNQRGWRID